MRRHHLFISGILCLTTFISYRSQAQSTVGSQEGLRVITTAVPFLTIGPDARASGMGDVGAATTPDANAAYWNPAKLAFYDKKMSFALSYSPWLRNLGLDDVYLTYLTANFKLRKEDALSVSMRYFNLGSIQFVDEFNVIQGDFNFNEVAVSASYSRQLSENFSIGVGGRYINSNIAGDVGGSNTQSSPANTAAVDLSGYWFKDISLNGSPAQVAVGGGIFNLGPKVSYTDNNNADFIPTNLRLGAALMYEIDAYNKFNFAVDVNKLMVPTPDTGANGLNSSREKALFSGVFGSFGDAPDGFSEEMEEVIYSLGAEYWYDNLLAIRAGYFHEAETKGARQYFTAGAGLRYQKFGLDFSYLIPSSGRNHPLANTVRFTLHFIIDRADNEVEESVTE